MLTLGLGVLPEGPASIAGFNHLLELARGTADPMARGEVAQALAVKLVALTEGAECDQALARLHAL